MHHLSNGHSTDNAQLLGWASIGIGLAEILAPEKVQAMLGIEDRPTHRGILRVLGVRELLHGVGILASGGRNRELIAGVWSRVAGDVLDSALLGIAGTKTKNPASFLAVAAAVAAIGMADVYYSLKVSQHTAS